MKRILFCTAFLAMSAQAVNAQETEKNHPLVGL